MKKEVDNIKVSDKKLNAIKERKERVRIANMVKRKPELRKICCICGKDDAEILHNKDNPYLISFICLECRKNAKNILKARRRRFDLREVVDKSKLSTKNFTNRDVKLIIDSFLLDVVSIGEYCKKTGISRYQFNQLLDRYKYICDDAIIKERVANHTNKVNRKTLSKVITEKNSFMNK